MDRSPVRSTFGDEPRTRPRPGCPYVPGSGPRNSQQLRVPEVSFDVFFGRIADTAMERYRRVGVIDGSLRGKHFGHTEFPDTVVSALGTVGCTQGQKPSSIDPLCHLADLPLDTLEVSDRLAILFTFARVRDGIGKCCSRDTDPTSRHVHSRLEAPALDVGPTHIPDSLSRLSSTSLSAKIVSPW